MIVILKMKYVFDLDGTLCTNTHGNYSEAIPYTDRIYHVNELYKKANEIRIYTARGMNTFNNDIKKVYEVYYEFTKKQLDTWGVLYTQLILGKPPGDFYIDDKGVKDEDYFRANICS